MSRILGIGNKTVNTYKQLKQIPSDDDIDSSGEEYTVFDKDDRSTIQLQLVPSGTENRKRPTEEVNIKSVKTNWRQCLLLLGVIVVALCGLTLGIVLVRFVQGPVESRLDTVKVITNNSTQSQTETSKPVTEATKGVTESKYEEDVTLNSEETVKWQKTWKDISGESCIRLLDVDGDGLDDILLGAANSQDDFDVQAGVSTGKYSELRDFCLQKGEEYPCLGYIIALRGYDGQLLWNLTVRSEVFLMNCEHFDIDFDGKPDCIGTGRQGVVVAFNPYTGRLYWSAEDDAVFGAAWNTYQAVPLPDWDADGVPEVLIANGGDPKKEPKDHDRDPGRLVVLSGRTGQMIGERYLEMPGSKETYMTPVMYHPPTGSDIILFGSGGETIAGDLMGISVNNLCHYIFGEMEAIDRCLPRERETSWPNVEKGIFVIVSGTEKGVMVPPVIVDVDGDSVSDILVSLFEGRMVLKNGRDLSVMWTASFPGAESYSTPAPGYFDDDDVVDFMVHWSTGNWPWYSHSNVTVISGKDGSVLWTLDSAHYEMNSDLVVQTSEPLRDLFLFKLKGRGSPYRRNESGLLVREDDVMRQKRHGEEDLLPAPNSLPPGAHFDKNFLEQEYRKYHITCDDDLTRHRGEMFLVDRSSMNHPLKILDIPLQKTWYDAPVVESMSEYRHDDNGNRKNQSRPTSHMGIQVPFLEGSGKDGSMKDPRANAKKFEKMCIMMDSDDRSTGAVADLDGDGVLEYISIYTSIGQAVDTMYSYYKMMYTYNIKVINLNMLSNQFKSISVPSASSFTLKQPLKDIRIVHTVPYSDQKWTQYMGKHGDSHYRDQN